MPGGSGCSRSPRLPAAIRPASVVIRPSGASAEDTTRVSSSPVSTSMPAPASSSTVRSWASVCPISASPADERERAAGVSGSCAVSTPSTVPIRTVERVHRAAAAGAVPPRRRPVGEVPAVHLGAAVPDHRGDALAGEPVGELLVGVAAAGQQLREPGPLGQPVPQVGMQPGRQHGVDQQAEADQRDGHQAEHGEHDPQPQRRGPHGATPTR